MFDPKIDPYLMAAAVGVTDGTINPQMVGGDMVFRPVNMGAGASGQYLLDQAQWQDPANGYPSLDGLSRMIVSAFHESAGVGSWTYDLLLSRGNLPIDETVLSAQQLVPSQASNQEALVVDNPLSAGALQGPTSGHNLRVNWTVTPGEAVARAVSATILLVIGRSPGTGFSDRGHVV